MIVDREDSLENEKDKKCIILLITQNNQSEREVVFEIKTLKDFGLNSDDKVCHFIFKNNTKIIGNDFYRLIVGEINF